MTTTEENYVRLGNGECIFYQRTAFVLLSAKMQVYSLFLCEFST